ncbi:MAG: hypothetical protein KBD25_01050 [Rickettsiaceae bacterium]|nr:hypothetical protein [Rickettsiaceae bacterium]
MPKHNELIYSGALGEISIRYTDEAALETMRNAYKGLKPHHITSFTGGTIKIRIIEKPMYLFRTGGPGNYWTTAIPSSPWQHAIDNAMHPSLYPASFKLKPNWHPANSPILVYKAPSGTAIICGTAAPQKAFGGGAPQVILPDYKSRTDHFKSIPWEQYSANRFKLTTPIPERLNLTSVLRAIKAVVQPALIAYDLYSRARQEWQITDYNTRAHVTALSTDIGIDYGTFFLLARSVSSGPAAAIVLPISILCDMANKAKDIPAEAMRENRGFFEASVYGLDVSPDVERQMLEAYDRGESWTREFNVNTAKVTKAAFKPFENLARFKDGIVAISRDFAQSLGSGPTDSRPVKRFQPSSSTGLAFGTMHALSCSFGLDTMQPYSIFQLLTRAPEFSYPDFSRLSCSLGLDTMQPYSIFQLLTTAPEFSYPDSRLLAPGLDTMPVVNPTDTQLLVTPKLESTVAIYQTPERIPKPPTITFTGFTAGAKNGGVESDTPLSETPELQGAVEIYQTPERIPKPPTITFTGLTAGVKNGGVEIGVNWHHERFGDISGNVGIQNLDKVIESFLNRAWGGEREFDKEEVFLGEKYHLTCHITGSFFGRWGTHIDRKIEICRVSGEPRPDGKKEHRTIWVHCNIEKAFSIAIKEAIEMARERLKIKTAEFSAGLTNALDGHRYVEATALATAFSDRYPINKKELLKSIEDHSQAHFAALKSQFIRDQLVIINGYIQTEEWTDGALQEAQRVVQGLKESLEQSYPAEKEKISEYEGVKEYLQTHFAVIKSRFICDQLVIINGYIQTEEWTDGALQEAQRVVQELKDSLEKSYPAETAIIANYAEVLEYLQSLAASKKVPIVEQTIEDAVSTEAEEFRITYQRRGADVLRLINTLLGIWDHRARQSYTPKQVILAGTMMALSDLAPGINGILVQYPLAYAYSEQKPWRVLLDTTVSQTIRTVQGRERLAFASAQCVVRVVQLCSPYWTEELDLPNISSILSWGNMALELVNFSQQKEKKLEPWIMDYFIASVSKVAEAYAADHGMLPESDLFYRMTTYGKLVLSLCMERRTPVFFMSVIIRELYREMYENYYSEAAVSASSRNVSAAIRRKQFSQADQLVQRLIARLDKDRSSYPCSPVITHARILTYEYPISRAYEKGEYAVVVRMSRPDHTSLPTKLIPNAKAYRLRALLQVNRPQEFVEEFNAVAREMGTSFPNFIKEMRMLARAARNYSVEKAAVHYLTRSSDLTSALGAAFLFTSQAPLVDQPDWQEDVIAENFALLSKIYLKLKDYDKSLSCLSRCPPHVRIPMCRRVEEQRYLASFKSVYKVETVDYGANGDCLFRALAGIVGEDKSLGLRGDTESDHLRLRQLTVDYMLAHGEEFSTFCSTGTLHVSKKSGSIAEVTVENFGHYTYLMRNPGAWGGHPEICAIARLLQRPVVVMAYGMKPNIIEKTQPKAPLFLYFANGNHYQAMYPTAANPWDLLRRILIDGEREPLSRAFSAPQHLVPSSAPTPSTVIRPICRSRSVLHPQADQNFRKAYEDAQICVKGLLVTAGGLGFAGVTACLWAPIAATGLVIGIGVANCGLLISRASGVSSLSNGAYGVFNKVAAFTLDARLNAEQPVRPRP